MRVIDDLVEMDWEGPLAAVGDVPGVLLYGVLLTFSLAAGPAALEALRRALEPVLGPATERSSLLGGKRLEWSGRTPAEATVRRGHATLRLGARIKGPRLQELVDGLAKVPEARDLRLRAAVRRFGRGKDEGPLDG